LRTTLLVILIAATGCGKKESDPVSSASELSEIRGMDAKGREAAAAEVDTFVAADGLRGTARFRERDFVSGRRVNTCDRRESLFLQTRASS
jgi:hypothetical protein